MIGGTVIDRVQSYKLLEQHISNDLTWNLHCETVYKKAVKHLYGRSCFCVLLDCTIYHRVASPAWAALPQYLRNILESVQKQAMRVIFPGFLYEDALDLAGLDRL